MLKSFLQKAIEENSVAMIDFFIQEGADVKTAVPQGVEEFSKSGPILSISQLSIGEHGGVRRSNTHQEVLEALKRHGLE